MQEVLSRFAAPQTSQRPIFINNVSNAIIAGSGTINDGTTLNRLIGLLEEKDKQINRLLGIIEYLTAKE